MTIPCTVEVFEAASGADAIVVAVGRGGESLWVRLGRDAMRLSAGELAARILNLMTLAHLRAQLELRRELEARRAIVSGGLATEDHVRIFLAELRESGIDAVVDL